MLWFEFQGWMFRLFVVGVPLTGGLLTWFLPGVWAIVPSGLILPFLLITAYFVMRPVKPRRRRSRLSQEDWDAVLLWEMIYFGLNLITLVIKTLIR